MRCLSRLTAPVSYHKTGIMQASEAVVYSVISRTQDYPKFIPWVDGSRIIKAISSQENLTQLTISAAKFKSLSYTSHVKMFKSDSPTQPSWVYSVCKQEPLKRLNSLWEISARGESQSYVSYKLDFEFSSIMYQLASNMLKDSMGDQLWNLFEKQALLQQQMTQHKK